MSAALHADKVPVPDLELPGPERARADAPAWRSRQMGFRAAGPAGGATAVARLGADPSDAPRLGAVGFFHADGVEATRAVLDAASAWLAQQGCRRAVGPFEGDTWHPYRLNCGPYESDPFPMEPWQPAEWPTWWEAAGWCPVDRYVTLSRDRLAAATDELSGWADRSARRGWRVRALDPSHSREELSRLYRMSEEAFRGAPYYADIGPEAFRALYEPWIQRLPPGFAQILESPGGDPAGFVFAPPDPSAKRLCVKTLAVLEPARAAGGAAALMHAVYRTGREAGLTRLLLCLIREGNRSTAFAGLEARVWRRYALMGRDLP